MTPRILDKLADLVSDKEPIPNKFTKSMGKLIKEAREDIGLNQKELAELIYRRQTTISDIENGKIEPSAGTLALLSAALEKPISFFYPPFPTKVLPEEKFTPLEHELLIIFRKIAGEHLQKMAVNQLRVISDFDPTDMLWDTVDITISEKERDAQIAEFIEKKRKKPKA